MYAQSVRLLLHSCSKYNVWVGNNSHVELARQKIAMFILKLPHYKTSTLPPFKPHIISWEYGRLSREISSNIPYSTRTAKRLELSRVAGAEDWLRFSASIVGNDVVSRRKLTRSSSLVNKSGAFCSLLSLLWCYTFLLRSHFSTGLRK